MLLGRLGKDAETRFTTGGAARLANDAWTLYGKRDGLPHDLVTSLVEIQGPTGAP